MGGGPHRPLGDRLRVADQGNAGDGPKQVAVLPSLDGISDTYVNDHDPDLGP